MLITKTYHDVPSQLNEARPIRIFVISPIVPNYPQAKFPGVVCFSEIYQVTGPVERFAGQIASHGYVVACPSSFHEFERPEPIPDRNVPRGTPGLSFILPGRTAANLPIHRRSVYNFPIVIHEHIHGATLGKGKKDNSLERVRKGDMTGKGELVMIFGKQDTHVPRSGRDLIRTTLEDANVPCSFLEVQAQHAFIRDESSKGRWDAALTRSLFTFMMEVFERTVGRDLGPRIDKVEKAEHVC
ncbi:hypothetical protein ID866_2152 [Astraeus odoratus]|nr:hypothetical protein ID866_2152 [Astraeus odoratus]